MRGKIDQYKPDFVIVDYLQLMSPNQKSDNETVRMKNLSRELKLMAISEEVLVATGYTVGPMHLQSTLPIIAETVEPVMKSKVGSRRSSTPKYYGKAIESDA